jgi:hypothetical protein
MSAISPPLLSSVSARGKTMAGKLLSRAGGADLKADDVVIREAHVAT